MELKNFIVSSELYDVYESDGLAVRIYKKPEYKEKCLYAALTHARVETTMVNSSIKMPVLHEVSLIDGKWAITMDWIKGKTLEQLMDENPDKMDTYLNQFIDIQCEIHAQYMPLLSKLKDKMARQIKSLGQIDEIKKYELLTRLDSMPKHIKLCHNSFEPKDIIINDEGTYVINWGSARQGNASADVAKTYLLLCLNKPEIADKYLDRYCMKSGTSKNYVQAWLPIVAAAQLDKGIESEKEFLLKWIDVVDYD
ncbi:aminoglycoside phosphotransferase [Ruminococcus sp. Marseille-P6503]|uniref:aminoglycoside phosphotransferase n=1 Tax=Ruminococcus sp. Marseille-P6503 TaxID=2364796 RepID=UPI000F53DC1E|nr:aminoglycoside phosphotransferase [Ruminococcus sp. Marseille-P6503]